MEELARNTCFVRKRSRITGFVFTMAMIFELRQPRIASLNELSTKLFTYYRTMLWNRLKLVISDLKSTKYLLTMLGQIRIFAIARATKKMNKLLLDTYEILVRKCKKERKKDTKPLW